MTPKPAYNDSLPTGQDEYPYNWEAPQLDWRTLPLDEIQHERSLRYETSNY